MGKKGNNSSASDFGWDFQHHAAIVMTLRHLSIAKAIRIEGKNDDIEITKLDGKKIFAQAKSAERPEEDANRIAKLKKALKTLAKDNDTGIADSLVFITNSQNPFNDVESIQMFSSGSSRIPFADLTTTCQSVIKEICKKSGYNVPCDKLIVWSFYFRGSDDNRYRIVRDCIRDFIATLGTACPSVNVDNVYNRWRNDFVLNASNSRTDVTISKENMLWPIIAWMCDLSNDDAAELNLDEGAVDEIRRVYRKIISDKTEDFQFVTRVISDFKNRQRVGIVPSRQEKAKYIASKWKDYLTDFDLEGVDEEIKQYVVSLAMSNIIRSRYVIADMKDRFGI